MVFTNANAATTANFSVLMSETSSTMYNQTFRYADFTGAVYITPCNGTEFDHCKFEANNWNNRDLFLQGDGSQNSATEGFVHDCEIWVVADSGTTYTGDDGLAGGNITVSNCFFGTVPIPANSYIGQAQQHQDLIQGAYGQIHVFNTWFQGSHQYGFYGEYVYQGGSYWVINCIFVNIKVFAVAIGPDSPNYTLPNNIVANNLCIDGGGLGVNNGASYSGINYSGSIVANNISVNTTSTDLSGTGLSVVKNLTSFSTSGFVSYSQALDTSGQGTNNNFHLNSTATTAIGQGTNLSSYFIFDKDGNPRQTTGNWDIGPYVYGAGGGGGSTNPIPYISPPALNFGTVPANTTVSNYFTLQNIGSGVLSGTASVAAPFHILSGGTYSLTNGQTQTVWISYIPSGPSDSQTVTFTVAGSSAASATVSGSLLAVLPGLTFPSYAGAITAPFTTNGGYLSQSVNTGVTNGGSAIYEFMITNGGNYVISANVNAPNTGANSLYVNVDNPPTDPTAIWDIPVTSGFATQLVSWRGTGTETNNQYVPEVFNLSAGTHKLIIIGREAGVELGQISFKIWPPPQIFIMQ